MSEKFPIINSTLSPTELGKLLQMAYGLSSKTVCSIVRLAMNHLYLVQDKERRFVFRVYTVGLRSESEIEEEIRLLLHLKEQAAKVAFPIADQSKQYIKEIEAPEGKRFGVLFSFAPGGKKARFSDQTAFFIGQALAKVHQSTEGFSLSRISYDSKTLLKEPLSAIRAFFTKPNTDVDFLEELSDFLAVRIDAPDNKNLRYGSIHLDVWFDNLHIDNEQDITFFDFDFCGNGYLYFDISYFLYQLYATNPDVKDYQAKADGFLKGYESVITISDGEKALLPFACLAIMTYYIGVQCDRYDYWTNIFQNEDNLKRMTANMKRWLAFNNISGYE